MCNPRTLTYWAPHEIVGDDIPRAPTGPGDSDRSSRHGVDPQERSYNFCRVKNYNTSQLFFLLGNETKSYNKYIHLKLSLAV